MNGRQILVEIMDFNTRGELVPLLNGPAAGNLASDDFPVQIHIDCEYGGGVSGMIEAPCREAERDGEN